MTYGNSVRFSNARWAAGFALSLAALTSASGSEAATSGANGTHDPSRMIESAGKFYVYSTGGGSKSSPDGLVWTGGPDLFPNGIPQSLTSAVPNNEGVWAPDVIFVNNQYYIYYALANAQNACAVGLVTTPTLDPTSPNYKLTDRGVVVSNAAGASLCAIDPCPTLDATGNLWISFGSGYTKPSSDNTIYLMKLDNATGLPASGGPAAPGSPLEPGHIEASYVYYHNGYYYLFWNSGGCCSGASSSYEIHLARSQTITGPYANARIFLQSAGSVHGPGQIGIYDGCGADRFTYHYYPDSGGSVLGENELSWGSDGWPVPGAASTTPLKACGQPGSTGSTGSTGAAGSPDNSDASSPSSGAAQGGSSGGSGVGQGSPEGGVVSPALPPPAGGAAGASSGDAVGASDDGGSSTGASVGSTSASAGIATGGTAPGGASGSLGASGTGGLPTTGGESGAGQQSGGGSNGDANSKGGCNVSNEPGRDRLALLPLLIGVSLWAVGRQRRQQPTRRG